MRYFWTSMDKRWMKNMDKFNTIGKQTKILILPKYDYDEIKKSDLIHWCDNPYCPLCYNKKSSNRKISKLLNNSFFLGSVFFIGISTIVLCLYFDR